VLTVVGCWLYNGVANLTGGIAFLEEVAAGGRSTSKAQAPAPDARELARRKAEDDYEVRVANGM